MSWWQRLIERVAHAFETATPSVAIGALTVDKLPDEVVERLNASQPKIAPYSSLSSVWHDFAPLGSVDYSGYMAKLVVELGLRGSAALDLACGTGWTTQHLVSRFDRVYGVDSSGPMLERARALGGDGLGVVWLEADFARFSLPEQVELVTCAGDALNYTSSRAVLNDVFRCVAAALEPGGVFLFDVMTRALAERLAGTVVEIRTDTDAYYLCHSFDAATGETKDVAVTPAGVEEHNRRYVSPEEIRDAAESAGLDIMPSSRIPFLLFVDAFTRDYYILQRPRHGSQNDGGVE